MLKRFEVENFKCFQERLVLDFTARDFDFNTNLVRNGLVNKALVYGKNGSGKSSLGVALFDITQHLTDKEPMDKKYLVNYRNLNSDAPVVHFKYVFMFDGDEVVYEYDKLNPNSLVYEGLYVNGSLMICYWHYLAFMDDEYNNSRKQYLDSTMFGNLNVELTDNKLSIIKYIYRNTPAKPDSPITKLMKFCENMLWYRSLSDGNTYCGFMNGSESLTDNIYDNNKLQDFQKFLCDNDLKYDLKFVDNDDGTHTLMATYNEGKKMTPFLLVASTGTRSLLLFYSWSLRAFDTVSFLFIDEFDAFFHYESAETIVKLLNQATNFQSMITSHNTYLMQNKLTRPDCCYLITHEHIRCLYDCTDMEIREAHNLEKMYVNGEFYEQ